MELLDPDKAEAAPENQKPRSGLGKSVRLMINFLLVVLACGVAVVLVLSALLWYFQHKFIYHPRAYPTHYSSWLPKGARELHFRTDQGKQVAFYVPPAEPAAAEKNPPEKLWVMFGGNGSVALDWMGWVRESPDREAGYLLIDYPGYGCCEGIPSPDQMRINGETALHTLETELGVSTGTEEFRERISVMGHSLGAAAALQFAARHPVERVVLLAPFTSMRDMVTHVMGPPASWLLTHQFDNEARLRELASRSEPPRVTVFHGDRDQIIPVEMSRKLAAAFPKMIEYTELPGADHMTVLDQVAGQLEGK